MRNTKHLYKVLVPHTLTWSFCVKAEVKLAAMALRVVPLVFGQLTSSNVKVTWGFAQNVRKLYKRMGPRGLAIYLKACSVCLQQAAGGMVTPSTWALGAAISRTRRGIPRIINPQHRVRIQAGDVSVIRLWLTLFGLYRVIEFKGALKLKTIFEAGKDIDGFMEEWCKWVPTFYDKIRSISGESWKLSPTDDLSPKQIPFMQKCSPNSGGFTSVMGILWDVLLIGSHPEFHSALTVWIKLVDGIELTWAINKVLKGFDWVVFQRWETVYEGLRGDLRSGRYVKGSTLFNMVTWQSGLATTSCGLHPLLPWAGDPVYLYRRWYLDHMWGKSLAFGALAFLREPGKIRVVAMVNLLTQTLMAPLHEWIFARLRKIPTDGTFNQTRPVESLIEGFKGKGHWVASYDLSAATDRIPIRIQVELLKPLLGERLADLWAYLLVGQPYRLPRTARSWNLGYNVVFYAVGQPMGALSSWAMLALVHHAIVQLAASKAYPRAPGWFLLYAVLGDDVVIADHAVAMEYLRIMDALGVEIGLAKSLVSSQSSIEFAKRTWIRGRDCSPISLAEFSVARSNLGSLGELVAKNMKFGVIRPSSVAISMGFGFRNLARLSVGLGCGNRLSKMLAYLCRPGGVWPMPIEAWLTSVAPGGTEAVVDQRRAWLTAGIFWKDILSYLLRANRRVSRLLHAVTTFKLTEATFLKKKDAEEGAECADRASHKRTRKPQGEVTKFFGESTVEFFGKRVLGPCADLLFSEWITYPYQLKLRRRHEKIDDVLRVLSPDILPEWTGLEAVWKEVMLADEGISSLPAKVEIVKRNLDILPPTTGLINLWARLRTLLLRESRSFTDVGTSFSARRMPVRRRPLG
jgi:hypothetical protein